MSTIVGLILLVGGITLYKTFALYEEKKEFNVLRGKIPNFLNADIKLAFTINGEVKNNQLFPNKGEGYAVKEIRCNNGVSAEWNNNLWGIVNIKNTTSANIECTIDFASEFLLSEVAEIGKLIAYTPSNTSYTIPASLTGYTEGQVINPSELNVWRIIKKNTDGTLDLISEYLSTNAVHFSGKIGYKNFVGALNTIASQYATENLTVKTRYFGYNNQTEYVSAACTSSSCTEVAGGGDTLYENDMNLVTNAKGSLVASSINDKEKASSYWISGRRYYYASPTYYFGFGRYIMTDGKLLDGNVMYNQDGEYSFGHLLRPIVTIRSDLKVIGNGTEENPWKVN